MATKLEKAKGSLHSYLESVRGGVFTDSDLSRALLVHREDWGLPTRLTITAFIAYLVDEVGLRRVELRSEDYRPMERFVWGQFSPYLLALSLRPRMYLTHGTAVLLHGLNDQLPKTIYANQEQSAKPRGGDLTQTRLTLAFSRRQRTSKYVYSFDGFRVVLLSGKHTDGLGVVRLKGPQRELLQATGLARTLIDIVVRPAYAGGVVQVLEAYRGARGKVEAAEIVRLLRKLDYVYPYHQAIGFLMERASYPASECEKLRRLGTSFDFYLTHGMKKMSRDEKWRLFFPEGF